MDIYAINEELVKTLDKMKRIDLLSRQFNATKPNFAKVNLIEKIMTRLNIMQDISKKCVIHSAKNDEKSKNYRLEGNRYFAPKDRNLFKAYELYNQSLCHAVSNENFSLAYANRSAVLFEWDCYQKCLENIKLAHEHEYPARLHEKLNRREQECLMQLKRNMPELNINDEINFQLSFDAHPKIPFIANCLDMKYTEDLGRYIYTKEDLKPGQLLSIEEEYTSCLLPSWKYLRCANCKEENFNLIPCKFCTCTMFCNSKCMEEANKNFHKYECNIIDFLFSAFNKIHLIGLRVLLTTLSLFNTIDDFILFYNNAINNNLTSFDLNYNEFTKIEHFKGINGLVTNEEKRPTGYLFQRAVITAVLRYYVIEKSEELKNFLGGIIGENFFTELLFKYLLTSPSNFHSVDIIENRKPRELEQCFASGAYAFGSLLNHSCAPNIVRIYKNTTTYMFVLRPIKANEILLDNYGYHYATQIKKQRLINLESQYRFICNCEACINDYKLYDDLPRPSYVPEIIKCIDINSLMEHNKLYALDNYQKYCNYLNKYSMHYPCVQISSVEESLKMAYNILFDSIAFKPKIIK